MRTRPWIRLLAALALCAPCLARSADASVNLAFRDLTHLHGVIGAYRTRIGQVPATPYELGTIARVYAPGLRVERGVAVDPWGSPYVFRRTDSGVVSYRLYSIGKNRRDDQGTGDDVVSREQLDVRVYPEVYGPALRLLPVGVTIALAPIAFAGIRSARRLVA